MSLQIRSVGPADAETVFGIVAEAFGARPVLDPPADAMSETVETIAAALIAHPGLMVLADGAPAGSVLLDPVGATIWLRRFAVLPSYQGRGIAHALVAAVTEQASEFGPEYDDLAVIARQELPQTLRFWRGQGFVTTALDPPQVQMSRPIGLIDGFTQTLATAEAMTDLGVRLGAALRAGDLVVLTGDLGAGKTTLTRGIGQGLGVRGPVTSPTFVIAREHPSLIGGPSLVHVDAYRLGGIGELDDLDLDTDLDTAVTVVEWGHGLAEDLAASRLEIAIWRGDAEADLDDLASDPRRVTITATGPRWQGVRW